MISCAAMDMEYRNLGRSGLKVSVLSYGAWVNFGDRKKLEANKQLMHMAYDAGINFFDNAEAYDNGVAEEVMGEILQRSGWRRDSYIVSSKVFFGVDKRLPTQRGLSRKHVTEACHAALKRLRVDYLDLYFCHRPDPETPIEETVLAMNDLIRQGKVFYWGTSEWSAQQLQEALTVAKDYRLVGPTMEQPQYNLLHRWRVEDEFEPIYRSAGLGTTIWSPLASGLLTGKYNNGIPEGSRLADPEMDWLREVVQNSSWEDRLSQLKQFEQLAKELEVAQPALAIAWCIKNPRVSTAILGATRPEQLEQNLKALEVLPKLTQEIMNRIDEVFPKGTRVM